MALDEKLRWFGFWALDAVKGGRTRKYYDQIKESYKKGASVEQTEEKIQKLIAHAVRTTEFIRTTIRIRPLPSFRW